MTRANAHRLYKLTELREAKGLTLAEMADYCGLLSRRGRESVGRWEQGLSVPYAKRRSGFLVYLRNGLSLNGTEVMDIWDVLVEEWQWEPLSEKEQRWLDTTSSPKWGPRKHFAISHPKLSVVLLLWAKNRIWGNFPSRSVNRHLLDHYPRGRKFHLAETLFLSVGNGN